MNSFPASIESHLLEAGFSSTEILTLKNLANGVPFSLRQIAAKTGKSTGVLDQATKKLIRKGIVKRECVNGSPKYTLASLDAVTKWISEHTNERLTILRQREKDVHLFFSSLKLEQERPSMEFFDGHDGMEQTYQRLLECKEDLLQYLPVSQKEEDHPLQALHEQFLCERRRRDIFLRVIAHDTFLGRRFQSRDHLAHRKTVLIPKSQCKFDFEQIIAGKTITCFHHKNLQACRMTFPSFIASQRALFEAIWSQYTEGSNYTIDNITLAELEGYMPSVV